MKHICMACTSMDEGNVANNDAGTMIGFQTPSPPIATDQSAGRKASTKVILVCHGATDSTLEVCFQLKTFFSIS